MSSNNSSSAGAWPPDLRSKRGGKLRNGTFVIPSTGERSRRQFTLRTSDTIAQGSGGRRLERRSSMGQATDGLRWSAQVAKTKAQSVWQWVKSRDGHQVLKCTLAYLLGSSATFWPALSDFLGHRDGKHIVATLTVYFHPARTVGSMLEAVFIALIAVAYAEIVCVLSMVAGIASRTSTGSVVPAHAVVLIVFVGGGLGFVGWVKQRLDQPLVNVASTLASMAIITVITKEESVQDGFFSGDKIVQVIKMLCVGIIFSVAVNLLVWRLSARRVLREAFVTASVCMGDRLSFITRGFLNGTEDEINSAVYAQVRSKYASTYAEMSKSLREAKLEHCLVGREEIYKLDKRLFKALESVYQTIGGLRSSLSTQIALLNEAPVLPQEPGVLPPEASILSPRFRRSSSLILGGTGDSLSVIEEDDEDQRLTLLAQSEPTLLSSSLFRTPSDIFSLFITMLGPSLKSLAYTLSETLRESPFGDDPVTEVKVNDQLRESLRDAIDLFNRAKSRALKELYETIQLQRSCSEATRADIEEVAAACGHFSFSLQAVADEMDSYLDILEELQHVTQSHTRSWEWLKFWKKTPQATLSNDPECEALLQRRKTTVRGLKASAVPKGIPDSMRKRRDSYHWDAAPSASTFQRKLSQKVLGVMRFLAREDLLFGIKVGIGAVLWAQFAFIPATRPMYQHWRGEWGLLSYMIVVGMTTGASNTTSTARLVGTLIGAACACVSWLASQGNAYVLALCGWLMALWNFYMILVIKNGPSGRIALLAYNVIVLYAYSLSQDVDDDDDDEGGTDPLIFDIAYHRVVAVVLGIIWGMIVCRLLWPISGRKKFKEGLSVLYLQLGLIWKRGPLSILLESNNTQDYMKEGEQGALQRYACVAFRLETLRGSAKSEFELRGPFPDAAYARIMHSTKHILDAFYAMRLLTQRHETVSPGERALLVFTADERVRLCQRICHVLQVLASCVMLEYPLTDAIPTIDSTKDQLLGKIYQFRKHHMRSRARDDDAAGEEEDGVSVEEKDYALLYAYMLVTAQVADELKKVRGEIEGLFGVLGQDELLLE
ncbi:60S ribosomal protein L19 [Metarhizium album ARSEF 1941]|uniref:60S ribosomal protein L19 n=1 Tax=Metarhizium album (strain ARSEF 1941) TaxID=1081103 RepID=A0A0B2WK13_METAS|nr:60S ribosomal protein L19 [Metarhizium album ARSEF 1941]KHN96396.1 60S ribosomal protein L19 [Metarhizium album ARSEF 1941]